MSDFRSEKTCSKTGKICIRWRKTNWWSVHYYRGKGNGNPFQYSCLGNCNDRGVWQAMVHGVGHNLVTEHAHHCYGKYMSVIYWYHILCNFIAEDHWNPFRVTWQVTSLLSWSSSKGQFNKLMILNNLCRQI